MILSLGVYRQIWWGHRIPAWYDENGNIFVAENEKEASSLAKKKNKNKRFKLKQETDVLDTWFSSAYGLLQHLAGLIKLKNF